MWEFHDQLRRGIENLPEEDPSSNCDEEGTSDISDVAYQGVKLAHGQSGEGTD